jgi:hypothetical protein
MTHHGRREDSMSVGMRSAIAMSVLAVGLTIACGGSTPAGGESAKGPAPTGGGLLNTGAAQIGSKTIKFASDTWIPVGLASEGIEIKEIRFSVQGGVHWNPLRAGIGPQAFVSVVNKEDHETRMAVAVALFDGVGSLLGATETTGGNLDPKEAKEITMTFREVKRRFFDAKSAQIAIETYK